MANYLNGNLMGTSCPFSKKQKKGKKKKRLPTKPYETVTVLDILSVMKS